MANEAPGAPLPSDDRARGIGLRGQIMLALITGLALAVMLVGIAIDRLASRAIEWEREHAAQAIARGAAILIVRADAPSLVIDRAEAALFDAHTVIGLEILDSDRRPIDQRGILVGISGAAPITGGSIRVWMPSPRGFGEGAGDGSGPSLVRMVVLYAGLTAIAIVVLCYVLLTRSIVRPVEELTHASERIARGRTEVRARVHGAAEVQRLALSFNRMGDDLRTERAALENRLIELEAMTRELRGTGDSLVRSEKMASVGRLAAGVAHEIGNPLAAILGLLEILQGGGLDESERAEFLRRIHLETERINRIIRDLLDFARRGPEERGPVSSCDLGDVVESAVHLIAPQKDLRKVTIEQRVPEDLPMVRGDADALTQVMLNLLLNAADALEAQSDGQIAIEIAQHDDHLRLIVTDNGPGVPKDMRDRIFEPFVTTKPAGHGTGLGLAVSETIIDRIGGAISVEDAPSGGARFVVRVPIAR